jgi:hypothetical protein
MRAIARWALASTGPRGLAAAGALVCRFIFWMVVVDAMEDPDSYMSGFTLVSSNAGSKSKASS